MVSLHCFSVSICVLKFFSVSTCALKFFSVSTCVLKLALALEFCLLISESHQQKPCFLGGGGGGGGGRRSQSITLTNLLSYRNTANQGEWKYHMYR